MFNPLDYPLSMATPRFLSDTMSWHGHIPFAFAITQMLAPKRIVELGVFKGDSYHSFCQAVDTLGLSTDCFGVDTWQGDSQAGALPNDAFDRLRKSHDPLYSRFSKLLRMTFDEALTHIDDGSVDLLHIDGLHTYEAVSHDFTTWLPKMSPRGVVLFHDTVVKHADFGVWKFWAELQAKYPSFEFHHSYGLGVLKVTDEPSTAGVDSFFAAGTDPARIRPYFEALGNGVSLGWMTSIACQSLQAIGSRLDAHAARIRLPQRLQFGTVPFDQISSNIPLYTQHVLAQIDSLAKG